MTLNQLDCGRRATITSLSHPDLQGLCTSFGMIPGATVEVLRRAPGNGPLQIKVQGTLYAMRRNDALHIEVSQA